MSDPVYKAHSPSGSHAVTDPAPFQQVPNAAGVRRRRRGEPEEWAIRLLPDGTTEEIPVTMEILLDPCPEIQILHSEDHSLGLEGLVQRLRRFVERLPGWKLFWEVGIRWPTLSRKISPDISVAENVPERELGKPRKALDVVKAGCRVRLVIEVVSEGPLNRRKDEIENPPRLARVGVDELVLIYLANLRKPSDPPLRVFSLRGGSYQERQPRPDGRFLLQTIGVLLGVEGQGLDEEVVAWDAATGERLRTVEEEAAAREGAERQVEEARLQARDTERRTLSATLLRLLENRGLALSDEARERIESCPDPRRLEQWIDRAFAVDSADELV